MPEISIDRKDLASGMVKIDVTGFLDAHTFEILEEALREAFQEERFRIIVDLAGVEYISSAGAGVFIGAHSESQENGGDIVLVNPSEGVKQVFELLGLTSIFRIVNDQSEAVAAFQ